MKKSLISIGLAAFSIVLAAPFFVSAQTPTTGLLNVYVQVINQTGTLYSPGNFQILVSGNNPSPSTFQGSQSGTLVVLNSGPYNVSVSSQYNFAPSYSVGCNSTINAGQSQTCVITMSGTGYPYPYPSNPQYPFYSYPVQQPLSCRTESPTVALGQTARFSAVGGVGGTYNWYADGRNFPNIGPVLSTTFSDSGSKSVTVTNAAQTATCNITVTNSYYPQPVSTPFYPTYGTTYPTYTYPNRQYPTYTGGYPVPTYTAKSYPRLPNTGFAPLSAAQLAFAATLLLVAGFLAYPYARKVFAIAVR